MWAFTPSAVSWRTSESPRAAAWGRYFEEQGMVAPPSNPSLADPGDGEVTYQFRTDHLLVPETVVEFDIQDGQCVVNRKDESKRTRSLHGLYRQLLQNMVVGVSQGYTRTLEINGVGYRAEQQGQSLVLSLGYSMPIQYPIPSDLQVELEGPNKIRISGIDKQRVGQMASEIRSLRPPEPYKGKGVKYEEEQIIRKVGKSGIK